MKNRPMFLNLFQMSFPVTAIASILHRLSGVALFFIIPLILYTLDGSLSSADRFMQIKSVLMSDVGRAGVFVSLASMIYHMLAGFRHIMMDLGICESKKCAKFSASIVIGVSCVLVAYVGYRLWCQ